MSVSDVTARFIERLPDVSTNPDSLLLHLNKIGSVSSRLGLD